MNFLPSSCGVRRIDGVWKKKIQRRCSKEFGVGDRMN